MALADLRQSIGAPPQTTMRGHLGALVEAGILFKERTGGFPGVVSYELRKPGSDLVGVAKAAQAWLAVAPDGPTELGTVAATSAIKAVVNAWSTTLLRALAARPLSLTELDALISGVSYPSLERRLLAMRMAGQVEAVPGRSRGTPYEVTEWLRRAIGPLVSAACWEHRHLPEATPPIGRIDVEAALLLALPLLTLDSDLSGLCQLAVEISSRSDRPEVGALAGIEEGKVAWCRARLEGDASARVSGSVSAWFKAVAEGQVDRLETAGDRLLAGAVLNGLHVSLVRPVAA